MKTRFRCRLSDSSSSEFRDFFFNEYDTIDECLRVAKAFRKNAELLVSQMKAMSLKDSKDWLAVNDFPTSGTSKPARARDMCNACFSQKNKFFEAELCKEIKSIRQESIMWKRIKKYPQYQRYVRVENFKYVAEIELNRKGKQLIKTTEIFTEIESAMLWVQSTLRAEAGKGFEGGMASVEKALQTHKGIQEAFEKTLVGTPEKETLVKSAREECMLDVENAKTVDMTPTFFTSTLRTEKPQQQLPPSNVAFNRKHLSSVRQHFFKDRFHI